MAVTEAAKEAVWLSNIIAELKLPGLQDEHGTTILIDNNSAMKLSKDPENHGRTKHIALRHHFIRQQVEDGTVTLKYVETKNNIADLFTKAHPRPQFERLSRMMGIVDVDEKIAKRRGTSTTKAKRD